MGTPAVHFVLAGGCVVSTSHVISPQTMGARRTERWAASLGAWRPGDVAAARRLYRDIRRARTEDPRSRATAPADVSSDNPLQATEDSGWGEYFRTAEVRDTIALDLERLHPGDEFYSAPDVQQALLNLLLVWSLENPRLGYRQGMHELASLVFSQRAKDAASRDTGGHRWGHSPAAPSMDATADDEAGLTSAPELSASHVEHDAYAMFAALMGADRDDECRRRIRMASFFEDPPGKGAKSGVQTTSDRVYARLEKIDPALRRHLDEVGIEPQLFLLRWLRVLFSREFHLHDAMVIWDAVIATNDPNDPNDEAGALVGDEPSSAMSGIDYANPGAMDFIESFAVAMLLFVRSDVLALDDFGSCLRRLQKFPPCEDVAALVERARTASFGKVDADEWIPKPHPAPPSSAAAARRDVDRDGQQPGHAGAGGLGSRANDFLAKAAGAGGAARDRASALIDRAKVRAADVMGKLKSDGDDPRGEATGSGVRYDVGLGEPFGSSAQPELPGVEAASKGLEGVGGEGVGGEGVGVEGVLKGVLKPIASTPPTAIPRRLSEDVKSETSPRSPSSPTHHLLRPPGGEGGDEEGDEFRYGEMKSPTRPVFDAPATGYEEIIPREPSPELSAGVSPAAGIEPATTSVPDRVSALRASGLIDPSPDVRAEALFGRTTGGVDSRGKSAGGLFDDDDPETTGGLFDPSPPRHAGGGGGDGGGRTGGTPGMGAKVRSLFADDGDEDPLFGGGGGKRLVSGPDDEGSNRVARPSAAVRNAASAIEGVLTRGEVTDEAAAGDLREALVRLRSAAAKLEVRG